MPHVKYRSPSIAPAYTGRLSTDPIPSLRLPDEAMEPAAAYRFIHDELMLDGSSRLNLATFVTTWMDPEAEKLMAETFDKNMIDKDEYPATAAIESRCVAMVADLFHAENLRDDDASSAIGASTVGSSEAVMLAGLALKWRWKQRVAQANHDKASHDKANHDRADTDSPDAWKSRRPNLVMGSNVQVVWEKFCRYFEIEPKYLPMADDRYVITPQQVVDAVDEDTIGVVGILGTTYTGELEPIAEICAALDKLKKKTGLDIPVHVDAASGGFVVPFLNPDLKWDFRLPRVVSINVSGHKYGLTYPGMGFVVWRSAEHLPEDLIFKVNYLGGDMPTFTLNFSRPGNQVIGQYYNFLRLGRAGYTHVMRTLSTTARWFSDQLKNSHHFDVISDGSKIPVIAFKLSGGSTHGAGNGPSHGAGNGSSHGAGNGSSHGAGNGSSHGAGNGRGYTEYDVSAGLRSYGWQVPAYTMPPGAENISVLRVVVREGFSADLARSLWEDLHAVLNHLDAIRPAGHYTQEHFAH